MTGRRPADRVVPLVRRHRPNSCLLLPGAGGGLQPYLRLASFLGRTHDVYAVPPLGLLAGEAPEDDMAGMVDSLLAAVDEAGVEPAVVLGWSFGGVLGWELCVRLADRGRRPDLVLVDAVPQARASAPGADASIEAEILGGLGPRADGALVGRVTSVFRGQVAALARHDVRRPYPGRVLLLVCTGEPREPAGSPSGPDRWAELAADLQVGELTAGHFTVFEPDHLPALLDELAGFLGVPVEVAG